MGREYTAMSALAGTDVPVPATYALCADPDVLGAPFYVMERVDGHRLPRADELDALGAERDRRIADALVEVLAALHAVDPEAVGLGELRPARGFPRAPGPPLGQAAEGRRPRAARTSTSCTARLAERSRREPRPVGIVHGDYRLDNCLVGAATGSARSSTGRWPRSATP